MSQKGRADNLTYRSVMHDAVIAERKAGGVATDLFRLARKAESQDEWEAQCQIQEEWVLSEEAGQSRCVELPGCWTQARSDIRGAFRAGVDLTKVPSYHKMKQAKAKANADKKEQRKADVEDAATQTEDVVILESGEEPAKQQRHGNRMKRERHEREPKAVRTVEEALADGEVVDAKSNMLVPPELMELVRHLNKLPELSRARLIKRFTKEARDMLALKGTERNLGNKSANA